MTNSAPAHAPADNFAQALAAYRAGRFRDAEELCRQVLLANRAHFEACHVLALAEAGLNRHEQALESYDRALRLRPDAAAVLNDRGASLIALDRPEAALQSYERAIAAEPRFAAAFSNRGSALERLERYDAALANYNRALALKPDFVDALYNRGNVLKALGRYDEAIASYDRALRLRPDHADALNNRGQALKELLRYDEALASYDAAIAADPDHVAAHCNAAALRLVTGDFERGWAHYEWRWKKDSVAAAARHFRQPQWRGNGPVAGKTVLVHSEQGAGDAIQFCRYVPMLIAAGADVVFEVLPPLHALMSDFVPGARVIAKGADLPRFDLHCPLLSLPLAFDTRLDTIPAEPAYLHARAETASAWQARLGPKTRPRIGLMWSGNPKHELNHTRSMPLRTLLPLIDADATFVSLQMEVGDDDAAVLRDHGEIMHFGRELGDFAKTAGLVAGLDLVITVDTSAAHLAGALGRPTWILLSFIADWRWLLDREDSPWYPTARLFRQNEAGDWDGVIARVRAALGELVAGA